MMKKRINKNYCVAIILVVMFFSHALYLFSQDSAKPPPLPVSDVIVDSVYDQLFLPQKRGFLGADGGASISLGPKRVLWIFGDTILGTLRDGQRKGTMVRNSIAIQKLSKDGPGSVTYYWDLSDRIPGAFFHPDSFHAPHWYWPGTGITINGKTYILLTRVVSGEGTGALSFKNTECVLFTIQNPDKSPEDWEISKVNMGLGDNHFNINTACLVEGNYLYLLGYDDGPEDNPLERVGIISRLPVEKLDSENPGEAVEFWSKGDRWLSTHDNLAPLYKPGSTESTLYYDPVRKRYISCTIQPFSSEYYLFSAEKLTGPWSEPQKIYNIPELKLNKLYHAYAGRIHPMLSDNPDELIMTYVVNTTDFWSMFNTCEIYYPRFIRVRFEIPEK